MMRAAIMREIWRRIRESLEESMRQQITALGFVFTLMVVLVGFAAFVSGNNLLFLLLRLHFSPHCSSRDLSAVSAWRDWS